MESYGFYSLTQAERFGSSSYRTPDGRIVTISEVINFNRPDEAQNYFLSTYQRVFPDGRLIGPVNEFIRKISYEYATPFHYFEPEIEPGYNLIPDYTKGRERYGSSQNNFKR